jgi:hypothetical protein
MPDAAYQMTIAVAAAPDRAVQPGVAITIDIDVTNTSPLDWRRDAYGAMRVGNHWSDGSGRMVQRDDGRTPLPSLTSGERCRLALTITTPQTPGDYVCEIDLAHEGVLWFSDRGAVLARFSVRVGDDTCAASRASMATASAGTTPARPSRQPRTLDGVSLSAADPGEFPMHGRPRPEVERLIAAHGGTLLHVAPDRSCGDDWISYRYFARTGG